MSDRAKDWDPAAYHRFQGHRLRPALDLLRALPETPQGDVIDLGCGAGDVGPALRATGLEGALIGVDLSEAMLAKAQDLDVYDHLLQADVRGWTPAQPPALIFSNAALHWVDDHRALFAHLVDQLAPGGTLAVQMPHQNNAPSHHMWRTLAEEFFPGRLAKTKLPGILKPAEYHHLLAPLGQVSLWETEYYQQLPASDLGNPVRLFTESTFARPILQMLNSDEQRHLIRAYEEVIPSAYPVAKDGSVLFPFRRLFFTVTRD